MKKRTAFFLFHLCVFTETATAIGVVFATIYWGIWSIFAWATGITIEIAVVGFAIALDLVINPEDYRYP